MYRSYYMTFTGEYRGGEGHGHEHNEDPHSAVAAHTLLTSTSVHASNGAVHAHGTGHAAHTLDDADAHAHGGHGAHAAPADVHAAPAAHAAHAGGHHGGTPHESPWQITLVLAILAGGSVLTLFLGIPTAWSHLPPVLEHWLEPVLLAKVHFAEPAH